MTIDEALTLLATTHDKGFIAPYEKQKEAIKLGIEALKFKQAWRQGRYFPASYLLPGETENNKGGRTMSSTNEHKTLETYFEPEATMETICENLITARVLLPAEKERYKAVLRRYDPTTLIKVLIESQMLVEAHKGGR